jgi:hypothetical protein
MPGYNNASPLEAKFRQSWLKSELAYLRARVALRALAPYFGKFDPDQPRLPAGQPGGGQWTDGDGGGSETPNGPGLSQELFSDPTGTSPFQAFANTYAANGALAAQLVLNRDGTATTTEWDTAGAETWAVRQKWAASDTTIITTTELNRDGTGQIKFGQGAEGNVVLASSDGLLALVPPALVPEEAVVLKPIADEAIAPITNNAVRVLSAGGATAGGAFILGMTAFSTEANPPFEVPLSDDVRLIAREEQQPPVVQERVDRGIPGTGWFSKWKTLPDVAVTPGPAHTFVIDAGALREAIGPKKFEALGNPGGLGVSLSMQAAPVAPGDVPRDSIFAGHTGSTMLYAPQGTVVDWTAHYAQGQPGQQTLLELHTPTIRGLSWSSGDDKPMIGQLHVEDVKNYCPRFEAVYQAALAIDARVRAANPGLSPKDLGSAIHREIAKEVKSWPGIDVAFYSEQGFFGGSPVDGPFLPKGSVRTDVLDDAGPTTVCIYDPKTGDADMRPADMIRYWREALAFKPGATQIYVLPMKTKRPTWQQRKNLEHW